MNVAQSRLYAKKINEKCVNFKLYPEEFVQDGKKTNDDVPDPTRNAHNDHKLINIEEIAKDDCNINFYKFLKEFYKNVDYIDFDTIKNIYTQHAEHILDRNDKYEPVIITTNSMMNKSNSWLTMYFCNIYNNLAETKGKNKIRFALNSIRGLYTNEKKLHNDIKCVSGEDRAILCIYCDDISYSGNQLTVNILDDKSGGDAPNTILDYKTGENNKLNIYLCLIGMSKNALKLLNRHIKIPIVSILSPNKVKIHEPKIVGEIIMAELQKYDITMEMVKINSSRTYEFDDENNIKMFNFDVLGVNIVDNKISITSMFKTIFIKKKNNVTTTYYAFKYPDGVSTIQTICAIEKPKYYLNLENLKKFKNLYREIFEMYKKTDATFTIDIDKFDISVNNNAIESLISNQYVSEDNDAKIIQFIENCENKSFSCDQDCPYPFYKNITNDGEYKYNETIYGYAHRLSGVGHKYIKYKKKYLELKKILTFKTN